MGSKKVRKYKIREKNHDEEEAIRRKKTIRHGVNINQNLLQIILDFEIFMS